MRTNCAICGESLLESEKTTCQGCSRTARNIARKLLKGTKPWDTLEAWARRIEKYGNTGRWK